MPAAVLSSSACVSRIRRDTRERRGFGDGGATTSGLPRPCSSIVEAPHHRFRGAPGAVLLGAPAVARVPGRNAAAASPMRPTAATAISASAYERSGVVVMPATRIVPAIAAPSEAPRFDTLRDRPEISP